MQPCIGRAGMLRRLIAGPFAATIILTNLRRACTQRSLRSWLPRECCCRRPPSPEHAATISQGCAEYARLLFAS